MLSYHDYPTWNSKPGSLYTLRDPYSFRYFSSFLHLKSDVWFSIYKKFKLSKLKVLQFSTQSELAEITYDAKTSHK